MAPRLIPSEPDFAHASERTLWEALRRQLPSDAFLAANVHLHSHEDFYEADIIVGYPEQGFLVIEVKGGKVWHTDDGWRQATSGAPRAIDPAWQADRAKRKLETYARDRGWRHGPIRFEHMVAFPEQVLDERSPAPDLPRWAVIAENDLDSAASRVWEALDKRISDKPRPSADQVAEMGDLLGGRPDPASVLLSVSEARADHVAALTTQQYAVLHHFRANDRVSITGGPGTGKTWLALEQARIWAASGKQVLFLCYSVGLARWLGLAVAAMDGEVSRRITVRNFHTHAESLGIEIRTDAPQQWWDVTVPELLAGKVRVDYDALVVDEAQDFADSWWPPLLASLRHPRVLVAGDEQQTVFPGRRGRPALDMAVLPLEENLRNTSQIAALLNPLAEEKMRYRGGDGPPVLFVPCPAADVFDAADAQVDRLLAAGHAAGQIAVLTTGHRHPNHKYVEQLGGKQALWDGYWMDDEVFYATVMGFKGLERPIVVLAVDYFHADVSRDVMYAGMSRARDQLVVCGDLEMIRAAVGDEVCRRLSG